MWRRGILEHGSRMLFECRDCHTDRVDTPMLKDDLWRQVSPPEEVWAYKRRMAGIKVRDVLCLPCVEKRLGHTVYVEDLNDSPWSRCVRAIVTREIERDRRNR
jgi:hypothetical protein